MNNGFKLSSESTYTAEIEFSCEGKECLLAAELELLRAHWPSIIWEIGIEYLWISGYNQLITEGAAEMFLNAVRRHEWWGKV